MEKLIQKNLIALHLLFPFLSICSDIEIKTIIKFSKSEARVIFVEKTEAPKSPVIARLTCSDEDSRIGYVPAEPSIRLFGGAYYLGNTVEHVSHPAGRYIYVEIYKSGLSKLKKESDIINATLQIPVFLAATKPEEPGALDKIISCSIINVSTNKRPLNSQAFLKLSVEMAAQLQKLKQPATVCAFVKDPTPEESNSSDN